MDKWLGRFAPQTYALLRIISGLMFAMHGTQKLFSWPGPPPGGGGGGGGLPPLMLAAAIIEIAGGLMIAFGLLTRFAAFIASGEMAVAYFKAHAPKAFWPILNDGELAVVYCFLFLFVAAYGAGIWSIDRARGAK